ncbi:hypothetical protein QUB00_28380 [Microcoleus sp. F8_C2]
MNSLLLISPTYGWGFKPILSGKGWFREHTFSIINNIAEGRGQRAEGRGQRAEGFLYNVCYF